MNLVIDIGNSTVKAGVFRNGTIQRKFFSPDPDYRFFDEIFAAYPEIRSAISISTRSEDYSLADQVACREVNYTEFDSSVNTPVKNLYESPETLGSDRLAAAVGACALYPARDRLIVDFGTALTLDVVTRNDEFLGGNISPGLNMRFRALHEFTGRLPLGEPVSDFTMVSKTTLEAIQGGVMSGILLETEGYIERLNRVYDDLCVIFTGGDADYFAKQLKNPIFANYDLVMYGLNRILEYNAI